MQNKSQKDRRKRDYLCKSANMQNKSQKTGENCDYLCIAPEHEEQMTALDKLESKPS
ncbi:hypothetical protein [Bifidobacterium sp. ESL0800]|uniref:hypothetical protein n=1 Tax=Bifidobacterium sp. ESL0800 TaxID=2983236 RepID=UPI0023F61D70|nr:hypothetical protein [Bifidobacterium sp. ESL0800]WEV75746.1 hypothetical protein OZX75_00590 [Bifidobacterium sp. ESL0800]